MKGLTLPYGFTRLPYFVYDLEHIEQAAEFADRYPGALLAHGGGLTWWVFVISNPCLPLKPSRLVRAGKAASEDGPIEESTLEDPIFIRISKEEIKNPLVLKGHEAKRLSELLARIGDKRQGCTIDLATADSRVQEAPHLTKAFTYKDIDYPYEVYDLGNKQEIERLKNMGYGAAIEKQLVIFPGLSCDLWLFLILDTKNTGALQLLFFSKSSLPNPGLLSEIAMAGIVGELDGLGEVVIPGVLKNAGRSGEPEVDEKAGDLADPKIRLGLGGQRFLNIRNIVCDKNSPVEDKIDMIAHETEMGLAEIWSHRGDRNGT